MITLSMKDLIAEHGVVGAGGAGFPTAVKLASRAETVILNAAECEPLLHKDKELLIHHWPEVRRGLEIAVERVGASRGHRHQGKARETDSPSRERTPVQHYALSSH